MTPDKLSDYELGRFRASFVAGDPDKCWDWKAGLDAHGYGAFRIKKIAVKAHRVALVVAGKHPSSLPVLHKCGRPSCVNPNHLHPGTHKENAEDSRAMGTMVRGSRTCNAIFTEMQIAEIKALKDSYLLQREVAAMFGVRQGYISRIWNGKIWKHVE